MAFRHFRDGKRPLVLLGDDGVGGLTALQRSLGTAMRDAGLGNRQQAGYTPHVTLMYGAFPVEERTIEPIRWTVSDFVLVHSHRGEAAIRISGAGRCAPDRLFRVVEDDADRMALA